MGKLGQELEVAIHSYNKAQKETEYTCLLAQLSVVFFFFIALNPNLSATHNGLGFSHSPN